MTQLKKFATATLVGLAMLLTACGGSKKVAAPTPVSPYASYDCPRLFKSMEHVVGEAKYLFTNPEDEDTVGKVGTGALAGAAGAAMAGALALTPLGWALAGGLMLGGAKKIVDGVAHEELSDAEKQRLVVYKGRYDEMRKIAQKKKCDYYKIPGWKVP